MIYKQFPTHQTSTAISCNDSAEGFSIEQKLRDIIAKKEPIDSTSPMIYTEKKDGVMPAYDIRTDRFEIALDATDKVNKMRAAKREQAAKEEKIPKENVVETPVTD